MADTVLGKELVAAYRFRIEQLRGAARRTAVTAWKDLTSYNEADIPRFLETVLPVLATITDAAVSATDAYLATFQEFELGVAVSPLGLTDIPIRPTPPEVVYRRPFVRTWTALSAGASWSDAVGQGRNTVGMLADTDTQLAARNAAQAVTSQSSRIVGYQRVLAPGKNCGLCIVASTQRYSSEDLMPIHSNCGCTVEPLFGTRAPSRIIDGDSLSLVKDQLRSADLPYTREAMSRLRIDTDTLPAVSIVSHGELGPTLWNSAHKFTDAA
ncbi:MAG: hypothetical protein P1T08_12835 [Acidimicrobiia bacterium]|nr:hypothetical protein [Acidimicrobiia bacterium]